MAVAGAGLKPVRTSADISRSAAYAYGDGAGDNAGGFAALGEYGQRGTGEQAQAGCNYIVMASHFKRGIFA